MPSTFAALDPITGCRNLLVEVRSEHAVFDEGAQIGPLAERMRMRGISLGLLVTRRSVYVVRWRFNVGDFVYSDPLPTAALLEHAGFGPPFQGPAQFEQQVRQWLEGVSYSWYAYLLPAAAPVMVPDVVGHLIGAYLETWPGLLGPHDAR